VVAPLVGKQPPDKLRLVLRVLYLLMHDPDDQPGKGFYANGKTIQTEKARPGI
jgi:hypothetical protein